jgi:hypothetical protein
MTPDSLFVELKQGESLSRAIKIMNKGGTSNFTFFLTRSTPLVKISDYKQEIAIGETFPLMVEFTADRNFTAGYYEFDIIIQSKYKTKEVPIVVIVKESVIDFEISLNVINEGKIAYRGQPVKANITLTNLKDPVKKDITLVYSIKNWDGISLDSYSENLTLEGTLNLERSIIVPNTTTAGTYLFFAKARNEKKEDFTADIFEVGDRFDLASFIRLNYMFILIILLALIASILIAKHERDKEKERLLNLYVYINQMKDLVKQNRLEEAIIIYQKIKSSYGYYSDSNNEDKAALKEEMLNFVKIQEENKSKDENKKDEVKKEDKNEKKDKK